MHEEEVRDRKSDETGSATDPLPRDWLPDALPPENHVVWEGRASRILTSTEGEWRVRRSAGVDAAPWLWEMGNWLRPAAALAAAAVGLLVVVPDSPADIEPAQAADEMALGLVASGGEPAALWAALGVPADPVLALLTLEDHSAFVAGAGVMDPAGGEIR
jgi:hypothetical protein